MSEEKRLALALNLDDYKYDARHCVSCHQCRWIDYNYVPGLDFSWKCPPWQYEQFDAYGAEGKSRIVYDLLTDRLDWSDPRLRDIVYKDMLCGACDMGCKRNLDFERQAMLESLRARMVEKGYGPLPEHVEITDKIDSNRNYYGKDQTLRQNWMPKDIKVASQADILYFVGCRAAFVDTEIAVATARILNTASADFMLMKDEPCCGHFVFITGQIEKARKMAEDNLKLIRDTGAKTVVFSCAEGYKTVKVDYPKLLGLSTSDLGFEVVHLVELVDEWVKEGRLKLENRVDMKVTYHDPCNLGRLSEPWLHWEGERGDWGLLKPTRQFRRGITGIYEPPRNILNAIPGIEMVEMFRHHENAWCCGSDGGVKEAYPDLASWTAGERLREAAAVGAKAIVSCCPACRDSFSEVADGIKAYDITELIAKSIGQ